MRFVTVLGVIVAGIGIGAAAVLAPLSLGTPQTAGATSGWMAGISEQAAGLVRSVVVTFQSASEPNRAAGNGPAPSEGVRAVVPTVAGAGAEASALSPVASTAPASAGGTVFAGEAMPKRIAVALENASGRKLTSSKPADNEARLDLVRDIQRELKRVGCYDGDVDGSWGAGSKRAISTFTERVNASLAIDEPDFILLTLLQGHKGQACSVACPAGQTAAPASAGGSSGRCVPNGVLAQANKPVREQRVSPPRDQPVAQRPTTPTPPAAVTTSEAKVNQMAGVTAGAVAVGSAWTAKVIPEGAKSSLASLDSVGPAKGAPQPVTPLPGRMAIGAPLPAPTTLTENSALTAPPVVPSAPVVGLKPRATKRVAAINQGDDTPGDDAEDGAGQAQAKEPAKPTAAAPAAPKQPNPNLNNSDSSRGTTVLRALDQPEPPARVVRRSQQIVIVQRPPPVRYQAPSYVRGPSSGWADNSKSARQRRLVYDLFQRPDRN